MSSILKALKKVEKETSSSGEASSEVSPFHARTVLEREMRGNVVFVRYLMGVIAVVGVLLGGWVLMKGRGLEKNPAVAEHVPPAEHQKFQSKAPFSSPLPRTGPAQPLRDARSPKGNPFADSEGPPNFPGNREMAPGSRLSSTAKKKQGRHFMPANNEKKRTAGETSPAATVQVSRPTVSPAHPAISEEHPGTATEDRLKKADPSWLRLQAISWAKEADHRIAVINNRIVHEGEMIDKTLIVRIDRDFVVVRRDGQKWRVNFNL